MTAHVLVVDPDPAIRQLLVLNLTRAGHDVASCLDAESALLTVDERLPDMLLLEWDLPGQSGQTLIRRLRCRAATRDLPIIMLSARAGEHDKILALESGADDYLTKPFNPRELLARIGAVLRRRTRTAAPAALPSSPETVQMAGLRLDPGTQRVTAGACQVVLGPVEFRLLNFLMHHPERVHTRSQLLDQVWGRHAVLDERTVDAHVGRLRNALLPSGHQQRIETVRGSGYRFAAWAGRDAFDWTSAA
jgi:two-component system phosphate regulon response regulator PhoB